MLTSRGTQRAVGTLAVTAVTLVLQAVPATAAPAPAAATTNTAIAAATGENFSIKVDCHSLARADIVALLDAGATRFGLADGVRLLTSL